MKQDPFKTDDGRSRCDVRLSNEAYRRVQLYAIHWKVSQSELVEQLVLKYLPPVQITFVTEPDPAPKDDSDHEDVEKFCPQCKETKPFDQFYRRSQPNKNGSPALGHICKTCFCAHTSANRRAKRATKAKDDANHEHRQDDDQEMLQVRHHQTRQPIPSLPNPNLQSLHL